MASHAVISIFCADRTGLVSAVAGRLFDIGLNLGDTTFAVLGEGAEFTSVCEVPDDLSVATIEAELRALPLLADATVEVRAFDFAPTHGPAGRITHRIAISGGDQPGLIARLAEVFVQFDANIVRLNAERVPDAGGERYVTRFAVSVAPDKADACMATVANTAGELRLSCHWEAVSPPGVIVAHGKQT